MHRWRWIQRSLIYYRHTHLAVVLGVATAVSVLAGALLVGSSVRSSLRDLFLSRLGRTDLVLSSAGFFPTSLSRRIESDPRFHKTFDQIAPLITTSAVAIHQENGRRASDVVVYGVDDSFWKFHNDVSPVSGGLATRDALISETLATALDAHSGDSLLLRLHVQSDIPAESLHGRKDNAGRTVRLTARQILPAQGIGEFSLLPQQGTVRAIFLSLQRLQKELEQPEKVNTLLLSTAASQDTRFEETSARVSKLSDLLKTHFVPEDLGIRLRSLPNEHAISLERSSTMLTEDLITKATVIAARLNLQTFPVFTYLANRVRCRERTVPYSLVTAVDERQFLSRIGTLSSARPHFPGPTANTGSISEFQGEATPNMWLNTWAASELGANLGDPITIDYYVWKDDGRLVTESANFRVAGIVPIEGLAADRDLVPEYPGISNSESLADWDPPFPMDLGLIRPQDEAYWKQYRTTPKFFVPLQVGQSLWKSRFGSLTSLRLYPESQQTAGVSRDLDAIQQRFAAELRAELNPLELGVALVPARAQGLTASKGATDFGEYFTYFSFFLVVSALLLSTLLFRLSMEQRSQEIGLFTALGATGTQIRALFMAEGLVLALLGSLVGAAGACLYSGFILLGLQTWWVDAVRTNKITLHFSVFPLIAGVFGGLVSSALCIAWTLRSVSTVNPRTLLNGSWPSGSQELQRAPRNSSRFRRIFSSARHISPLSLSAVCGLLGLLLLALVFRHALTPVAGFFGAGSLWLLALLALQAYWLRNYRRSHEACTASIYALGFRNTTARPGRSLLCIALIAFAVFIIVAIGAFRRDPGSETESPQSGTGGFPLFAQSLLPIFHDLNTSAGREAMNLNQGPDAGNLRIFRFRVREGEDASCLNLYRPQNPRILSPTEEFLSLGRFKFADMRDTPNPWLLLNRTFPDGAIPMIADANSLEYVLHLKVGDDWILHWDGEGIQRLRVVAALNDSIFQRELLISEANFKKLFPAVEGYRFFLIDAAPSKAEHVTQQLEQELKDYGLDVQSTWAQLADFHKVENTYLSTFQALGGLGLLLGTVGLAVVLMRNTLERRRELALLRAVGYRRKDLSVMILFENIFLLTAGLIIGSVCALLAIAPALSARGDRLPELSLLSLLLAVFLTGSVASLAATAAAVRLPLLQALRSE